MFEKKPHRKSAQGWLALLFGLLTLLWSQSAIAVNEYSENAGLQVSRYSLDPTGHSLLSPTHTDLLRHLELFFQSQIHYVSRPLVVADADSGERYRSLVAHRAEATLSLALGLYEMVDIALLQPITLEQLGRFPGRKMGETASSGLQDTRLVAHARILNRDDGPIGLGGRGTLTLPTGQTNAWMSHEGLAASLELLIDSNFAAWHAGARFGYEVLPANTIFELEQDDQIALALSASWQPEDLPWRASVEWNMATRANAPFENSAELYGEILAATGYRIIPEVEFTATMGMASLPGFGGPEYRFGLGFNYSNDSLVDDDNDGIPNPMDNCPSQKEDMDGFEDEDGCPDLDNDGDTIPDSKDPCPNEAEDTDGFQDNDGCPDLDNDEDGVPDAEDSCPLEAEDKDDFQDNDGCPDLDDDEDTILDTDDACRLAAEDFDEFEDEDGCPDPDNDKDGLLDEVDQCPNEAEVINGNQDEDGCPDEGEESVAVEGNQIEVKLGKVVFFERGRARLQSKARPVLEQLAQLLKNHQEIKLLRIIGHTDKLGSRKLNEKLAQRRADWMKYLLVKQGVASERIEAIGKAWDQPRANNESNRGRARNRRVEFEIVRQEQVSPKPVKEQPLETKPKEVIEKATETTRPEHQEPRIKPPIPQVPLKK